MKYSRNNSSALHKSVRFEAAIVCTRLPPRSFLFEERGWFHLNELGKNLDTLTSTYDNIILLGDFNTEPTDTALSHFCEIYNFKNLIKDTTCFKNPNKPSCIDLIITNRPKSLQNSMVIETGLSDFHNMCITVMKMCYSKQKPSIIHYHKFKDLTMILS